jgi:hypothetical protein
LALHKLWIVACIGLGKSPQHTVVVIDIKIMAHKDERELSPVIAVKRVVLVPDNALKLSVPYGK